MYILLLLTCSQKNGKLCNLLLSLCYSVLIYYFVPPTASLLLFGYCHTLRKMNVRSTPNNLTPSFYAILPLPSEQEHTYARLGPGTWSTIMIRILISISIRMPHPLSLLLPPLPLPPPVFHRCYSDPLILSGQVVDGPCDHPPPLSHVPIFPFLSPPASQIT